ncbi:GTPase-associated system all-helical protein GASH [Brevundimonas pondensis]|uniref:GTPase-associated system helical domain-containing protein n=1 Tax=Brevundimonas pondensis TaxID=2774189 RepID=A0ABX7SQX1_9CAUL|nr:GTPase-associated system all-helical protein GASH [Brevundimonas pondensis]QTC89195.1 hypothetical protein IFE19_07675 [Brevundimonas pondensis]
MAKYPLISSDFAGWYAQEFMDETSTRDQRWKTLCDLLANPTAPLVEVLVRLAFATKAPASGHKNADLDAAYQRVVQAFKDHDPAFDPAKSARDFQVVCAAVLVKLFSNRPAAALAVTTTAFAGARKPNLPMDLVNLAGRALIALSAKQHERVDLATLLIEAPSVDFEMEEATDDADTAAHRDDLGALKDAVDEALGELIKRQNATTTALLRRIALSDEELQMLWWLMGGRSRELQQAFGDIEAVKQPLILGRELGRMTTVSPGPVSVGAMLAQAGLSANALKLADVVNSVGIDWARAASDRSAISPATTPIHFALEKRSEVDSTDAWQAGWEALTGLSATGKMTALDLAEQFYREHLFLYVND